MFPEAAYVDEYNYYTEAGELLPDQYSWKNEFRYLDEWYLGEGHQLLVNVHRPGPDLPVDDR